MKSTNQTVPSKQLLSRWDNSFSHNKKAWRQLVKAQENAGQKTFYFMVLDLQKELKIKGAYKLKKNYAN